MPSSELPFCRQTDLRMRGKTIAEPRKYTISPYVLACVMVYAERGGWVLPSTLYVTTKPRANYHPLQTSALLPNR